jgi:hypothetical protein
MIKKIVILILFSFLLTTCGFFNKNIFRNKSKEVTQDVLIDSLTQNSFIFNTIYFKFDVKITSNGKDFNFSGNLKMKNDSAILVSVSPFGFEVGRGLFTKDSIIILNKIQNQFFKDDYEYLLLKHNLFINYEVIQNILTNNLFYYSNSSENVKDVDLIQNDSTFILNQLYTNDLVTYNQKTVVNSGNFKIQKIKIQQINTDIILEINYSNYENISNYQFPLNINILYQSGKTKYEVELEISKILLNKELKFNTEIPNNYVRVWY